MRKQLQPTPVKKWGGQPCFAASGKKVGGRRCLAGFGNKVGELAASADSGKTVAKVNRVSVISRTKWVS